MLTDRQIQAALKSDKPEVVLNDRAGGKGTGSLKLVVRGGSALWFGTWYDQGKLRKKQLGRYPDLGLREARDAHAEQVRAVLAEGKNPKAIATATDKPTVEKMFKGYLASLKTAGKTSHYEAEHYLVKGTHNAADALGLNRNASDVDPSEVSAYLAKAYKRGARVVADRTRSYLSAAFNWAIKANHDYTAENRQDWGIKFNPVEMVRKDSHASKPRERNLSADEIKAFWHGMNAGGFSLETRACLQLVILCGQRVQETLRLEGSEIDFKEKTWNMPAHKTKGRKYPHTIPLPELAIHVLQELVAVHGAGALFPARADAKAELLPFASVGKAVKRWCKANDFPEFSPRDLRRTWKSRTADAGVDRFMRDLIQQHAKGDTGSRFYDKADYLPQMREAMKKWNEWLVKTL